MVILHFYSGFARTAIEVTAIPPTPPYLAILNYRHNVPSSSLSTVNVNDNSEFRIQRVVVVVVARSTTGLKANILN